jgi:hypothetical protein
VAGRDKGHENSQSKPHSIANLAGHRQGSRVYGLPFYRFQRELWERLWEQGTHEASKGLHLTNLAETEGFEPSMRFWHILP